MSDTHPFPDPRIPRIRSRPHPPFPFPARLCLTKTTHSQRLQTSPPVIFDNALSRKYHLAESVPHLDRETSPQPPSLLAQVLPSSLPYDAPHSFPNYLCSRTDDDFSTTLTAEREVFRRMRVSRHEQRFPIPSPISPACPLCPPQNRDNAFLLVTANRARVARVHPPSVHVAFNRSRERFPRRAKRESQRVKKSEKIVAERQLLLYFLFQRCFGGARTDFVFPV
ncbi:hypothetical protein DFJ73DRAFT_565441 [Zopfochytrium polystomum]|nr:hypothetical protein DFJ73DRAFT_565441 [Zopfochytrium polystomum]